MLFLADRERRKPSWAAVETKLECHPNNKATEAARSVESEHRNEKELYANCGLKGLKSCWTHQNMLEAVYCVVIRFEDKFRRILYSVERQGLPAVCKRNRHYGSHNCHVEVWYAILGLLVYSRQFFKILQYAWSMQIRIERVPISEVTPTPINELLERYTGQRAS